MGDRFGQQARAQLQACMQAAEHGVDIVPVWNKSDREHNLIGSRPPSVRAASEKAVKELNWKKAWHVDADHIRLKTVDGFMDSSDFFTIDVTESIGQRATATAVREFVGRHPELVGKVEISGIDHPVQTTRAKVEAVANKYLCAAEEAGRIYRRIAQTKGAGRFITEISLDETDEPQIPLELLIILAALADEQIPVQTIAPKFTGRFNKGVDYIGNLTKFEHEFNEILATVAFAVEKYHLPGSLKLSIHSGSDKFSIYEPIRRALKKFDAGLHVKTAGTSWLEELIGLAESGGEPLDLTKEIYCEAVDHRAELCAPYATVTDIDIKQLPSKEEVRRWTSEEYAAALRHDAKCKRFNPHFRQLLHVGFKIAAQKGTRYIAMLKACEANIARNVTTNLYERHLKPLFVDG